MCPQPPLLPEVAGPGSCSRAGAEPGGHRRAGAGGALGSPPGTAAPCPPRARQLRGLGRCCCAAAGLPARLVGAGMEQHFHWAEDGFVSQAGLVCKTPSPGIGTLPWALGCLGSTGTGREKGLPVASQPWAALNRHPELLHPGQTPPTAQRHPENPAGTREGWHIVFAEQHTQQFPVLPSQSSHTSPSCVLPTPNPCPSSLGTSSSSSVKARGNLPLQELNPRQQPLVRS